VRNHVDAAFDAVALEDLVALREKVAAAVAAVQHIDTLMRAQGSADASPDFDELTKTLKAIARELGARVAARNGSPVADTTEAGPQAVTSGPSRLAAPGAIGSREDAIRALDAVAEFFRRTEPSSPVPLFVDRAKRLVAKDFLEVLADVAPDALAAARAAGGVKAAAAESE
jgi:type VI secretion system protein ImpA